MRSPITFLLSALFIMPIIGCSTPDRQGNRRPANYSRAGREYKEPRAMNHRRMDTDSMFRACLRERTELYCRNRMGR